MCTGGIPSGAVYIATPTAAKEEIALAAIVAGKHVLVEKPLVNHASVVRMTEAAERKALHSWMQPIRSSPRTEAVRKASPEAIVTPQSLHTAFYFPFSDRTNICFAVKREPMKEGWIMTNKQSDTKHAITPTGDARCASGVEGLDEVLGEGLASDCFYLVQGDPGSGKTTLALQSSENGSRLNCTTIWLSCWC